MFSLKRQGNIAFLIAVGLLLVACDESFDLTLNIRQTELISTFYTDTLTLRTGIQYLDSVQTNNFILVGSVSDEEVGTLRAESFFKVLLPRQNLRFTTEESNTVIFDSLVLILNYNYQYGDTTAAQTIVVNRLTVAPDTARKYYSFDKLPYGEEVGRLHYKLPRNPNVMRIKLSDALGREIISKEGKAELQNQTNFEQYFKGLRLAAEGPDKAAIFGFDLLQSRMTLYFRNNPADTVSRFHNFFFYNPGRDPFSQLTLSEGSAFAHLQPNYQKGQLFASLPSVRYIPTRRVGNLGYVHTGMQIATRIEFPYLQSLQKPGKRILINRALLSFQPSAKNFEAPWRQINAPPPTTVILGIADQEGRLVRNAAGNPLFVPEETNRNLRLERSYIASGRTYPDLDITTYLQNALDSKTPNYGILLMNLLNTAPANLLVIGDQQAIIPTERLRLILFYTELSQQ
ncbi:MAG: DUF4270 family protein [Cytophagales bacterium]|nr:DUF4270 domain-containing protein [Bernardetiaceae bacterium]MDW8209596.1 DUF4270 family protein [Cytophagales bacterium]